MERRSFISRLALTLTGMGLLPDLMSSKASDTGFGKHTFKLNYAPHFGMFNRHAPGGMLDELDFMAAMGFRAVEDNEMKKRSIETQRQIASRMEQHDMTMGVFVAHTIYWNEPNLAGGDKSRRNEFLKDIETSIEVARRVRAKWMTVVPGHLDLRKDLGYQTSHVVETLKRACEKLEPHNLVMVLEPLNFRDHPGMFLTRVSQAYEICKAVDSPSCKILFDIYHQQITEGNIIPNIDLAWDEIAYFQIGDNPGRKEPTTGELNYRNIFKHIHQKGFSGVLGMEHGNAGTGKAGEESVIEAYVSVDDF